MRLLGSTKKDVDKDKDAEDAWKLESAEVFLVHCNLVSSSYQEASKVSFAFIPNKQFGQLITIAAHLLTLFRMGFFGAAHRWGEGGKKTPSLKSVTHIL